MKKNILKITFAAALAVVAGVTAYQAQDKEALSDLALANVEALARMEGGSSNTGPSEETKCYGGGHRMVCRCINSQPCTGTDCY